MSGFQELKPNCKLFNLLPDLKSSEVPFPRSGHRLVANDRYAVSIGGYHPELWNVHNTSSDTNYPILKEVWVFNFLTQRWTKLRTHGQMPKELASHSAILVDDYAIVYGGTSVPFGYASSNQLHSLNLKTGEWKTIPLTAANCPDSCLPQQYGHAFIRNKNELFIIGGTSGHEYNMQVYKISNASSDLNSKHFQWEALMKGQEAEPRYRHEGFYFDEKLHIIGGGTALSVCDLTHVDIFDISSGLWSKAMIKKDPQFGCPAPRRCHGLAVYEDPSSSDSNEKGISVFISGGYDGRFAFNDVWELKMSRRNEKIEYSWHRFSHFLPRALYFHGMAATPNGSLIIFGGVDGATDARNSTLYRCWLKPPPLAELALKKIVSVTGNRNTPSQVAKLASELNLPEKSKKWIMNKW